mmetsp:Transcript_130094/g.352991  ORF Transcript_130094/g.352991 Transcript_130094/m.352991 type:complete len:259 (+) Transcript_130094:307-1083(+)
MAIDPHHARAQLVGKAVGGLHVGTPHGGSEAVRGAVRPPDRLLVAPEGHHGQHGAELFLVNQPRALLDAGDDGGQEEEARVGAVVAWRAGDGRAAAQHLGAIPFGVQQQLIQGTQLHVAGQRAQLDALVEAVPQHRLAGTCNQRAHERLEDVLVDIEALDGNASLPVVEERGLEDTLHCLRNVAVVANDGGIVAAELQQHPGEPGLRARGHDLAAHLGRAREDHLVHQWVAGNECARIELEAVCAHNQVEHARGEEWL